jgi:putative photosynthetic complex assembly protein
MPAYHSPNPVPRAAIIGAGAFLLVTLLWVGATRMSGEPIRETLAAPAVERNLRFEDLSDGGVAVRDASDGRLVAELAPGSNHFLRALMRGLVRERVRQGQGDETPFQLTRRVDGQLTLIDPMTRRVVDLGAFGTSNATVFAAFLNDERASPSEIIPVLKASVHITQGNKP